MDLLANVLVAAGLSMDSAAVSVVLGSETKNAVRSAGTVAILFGIVQASMFAAGGFGGESLSSAIAPIDHWVAFFLLSFIGAKMIIGSLRGEASIRPASGAPPGILWLAFATSIDAVVVGAGLGFADNQIGLTAMIVGIVTAAISACGVLIGSRGVKGADGKAGAIGGVVLIAIGIRILLSHLGYLS